MAGHDSRMPEEGVSSFAHSLTPDKATKTPTKVVLWFRLCHDHHFLLPRLLSGRSVTTKTRTTTAARSHSAFSSIPGVAFPRVKVHVLYDAQLINHDTDGRTERRPGSKKRIIDSWIEYRPVESANFLTSYFDSSGLVESSAVSDIRFPRPSFFTRLHLLSL